MNIQQALNKLSSATMYVKTQSLPEIMEAIVEQYHSIGISEELYAHVRTFLHVCIQCKLVKLYTRRKQSGHLSHDEARKKESFCVDLPYHYGYDNNGRWTKIQPPPRPMTYAELYKELQEQVTLVDSNPSAKGPALKTDIAYLKDLAETLPKNISYAGFLIILQATASLVLETQDKAAENFPVLVAFLTEELTIDQKLEDQSIASSFKDPHSTTTKLSIAINNYRKYLEAQACRDTAAATPHLCTACVFFGIAYELGMKYYLSQWTPLLVASGKRTAADMDIVNNLTDTNADFLKYNQLKQLFLDTHTDAHADPVLQAPAIEADWALLDKGWGNYNRTKHIGAIPPAQELGVQIKELARLICTIIPNCDRIREFKDFYAELPSEKSVIPAMEENPQPAIEDSGWLEFSQICGGFDYDNYHYVLVAPAQLQVVSIGRLLAMPWDMIIDMNPASEKDGLMSMYQLLRGKSVTARTPGRVFEEFVPIASPYWIRGNGIFDDSATICSNYRTWALRYGQHFRSIFQKFHTKYTSPVKVIYLPGLDADIQAEIMKEVSFAFSNLDGTDTYGVEQILMGNHELIEAFESTAMHCSSLPLETMLENLAKTSSIVNDYQRCSFPGMAPNQELDPSMELEDFCDPVHLNLGTNTADQATDVRDFYRGARKITWRELALRKDLPRDCYQDTILPGLKRRIAEAENSFFTIGYRPGHGGTTLLRRIAWDLHNTYPTLIIQRYFQGCARRLLSLRNATAGKLVLLIDSNDMTYADANHLFDDLRLESIPAVIIFLMRRERAVNTETYTLDCLNQNEISQMVHQLISVGLEDVCKRKLERMLMHPILDESERTPFCLSMYAFDKDFEGFRSYVRNFLNESMQDTYRKLLLYIALSNRASNGHGLDLMFLASFIEGATTVKCAEQLLCQKSAFSNLVTFRKETKATFCKMRYSGIAEEVLLQLTTPAQDANAINYYVVADYIRSMIEEAAAIPGENKNLEDFFQSLLIDRDFGNYEDRETFAPIILAICREGSQNLHNDTDGGINAARLVMETLAKYYPYNAHFVAHYGRFISEKCGRYEEALVTLDKALSVGDSDYDSRLLHMKGTIYFRMLDQDIKEILNTENNPNADRSFYFQRLFQRFDRAQELFEQVRQSGTAGITGMLSNIKMCISIINLGKRLEKLDTDMFFQKHIQKLDRYRILLDRANSLFEECETYADYMSSADKLSYTNIQLDIRSIRQSRGDCIAFYEDRLKDMGAEDRPMLRRHLARVYDSYSQLDEHKNNSAQRAAACHRIMELMSDNILDDPSNTANYRQWFRAAFNSNNGEESLVDDALSYVNQWQDYDEKDPQAHLYRYMLTFLRALDGETAAEARLHMHRKAMQEASWQLSNKTDAKFILTHGTGLQRLKPLMFNMSSEEEARKYLLPISGHLSARNHHIIHSYSAEVYFNAFHTKAITDKDFQSEAHVTFGLVFSYDGPRAHNATVQLQIVHQSVIPLCVGKLVRCSILQLTDNYLILSIHGYADKAKLMLSDLAEPYSEDNLPVLMTDLDVCIKANTEITYHGNTTLGWLVTMQSNGAADDMYKPLAGNEVLQSYLKSLSK